MSAISATTNVPTNAKLLETVLKAVPYAHLITDIDLHTQPDVVRFTWRGIRYRVDARYGCEEIQGDVLAGTDRAILMTRALQLTNCALRNDRMVLPA